MVPLSQSAKNPLEAVLIWMILSRLDDYVRLLPKRLTNVGGRYAQLFNCLLKLLRGHSICLINRLDHCE
jgi:nitrate reductase assembly molybdenum cofactor insertion protein NarJ